MGEWQMQNDANDEIFLPSWADIANDFGESSLLVGNGLSCRVWPDFAYPSLYDIASGHDLEHQLSDEDRALFEQFDTQNFEEILRTLAVASRANQVLAVPTDIHMQRHEHIRRALLDAVHAVHVPWNAVTDETLNAIADVLASHTAIYTTNYDLLIYWAIMRRPALLSDCFWGACFNINDCSPGPRVPVYFLHGALHFYRTAAGTTCKLIRNDRNLLELFLQGGASQPVFVSEGGADEKLRAIRSSEYLNFAYGRLTTQSGPFVIFGHGLSDQDRHVAMALRKPGRRIAVGIRADSIQQRDERQGHFTQALAGSQLTFFDAATYPLANPAFEIQ